MFCLRNIDMKYFDCFQAFLQFQPESAFLSAVLLIKNPLPSPKKNVHLLRVFLG